MLTVETRRGRVVYEQQGSGRPLLLLHANPGDHRDFESIIPALAARYRVIALDWPGYGESPAPQPPQSASAMLFADVLEDFTAQLGIEDAILIGNSVGGYAAARLAISQPQRVAALILVSSGGFTPRSAGTRLFAALFCRVQGTEFIKARIATRFARFYLKRRNPAVERIIARTEAGRQVRSTVAVDAAVWRSFTHPDHDLRARAAAITVPTLIIHGRYDRVIPATRDGKSAAASIPGARLLVLDTGHEPFAEDEPAFMAAVTPFLEEVERKAERGNHSLASHC